MPYTIDLSVAISADRTTGTITDNTVFGNGNPPRQDVLVFLTGYKMNYDNTVGETLALTPNSDPDTVSSWIFDYPTDGWFKFYYVIIKVAYDNGTSYNIYDVVYDGSLNVYRSKINGNVGNPLSDIAAWELISDPATLANNKGEANESENIESTIYQRVLTANSQYGYASFVANGGGACCGDCDQSEVVQKYKLLSLLVNAAIITDYRSELPQGEKICRKIESVLSKC